MTKKGVQSYLSQSAELGQTAELLMGKPCVYWDNWDPYLAIYVTSAEYPLQNQSLLRGSILILQVQSVLNPCTTGKLFASISGIISNANSSGFKKHTQQDLCRVCIISYILSAYRKIFNFLLSL